MRYVARMTDDRSTIRALVKDNRWFHTAIGIFGNACFVVGSVFFLFENLQHAGVWLFILGSAGMLIDSVGTAIAKLEAPQDA